MQRASPSPWSAVEGSNVIPDNSLIQSRAFHPCHESGCGWNRVARFFDVMAVLLAGSLALALLKDPQIVCLSRRFYDTAIGDFAVLPLAPLLADLAETFEPLAEDNGQTHTLLPVAAGVAVLGDVAMLVQLVANLIQNAISHCPGGTAIALGAFQAQCAVVLWLADTGPGIPEAEREKVFELFYRDDPNRSEGGQGGHFRESFGHANMDRSSSEGANRKGKVSSLNDHDVYRS